MIEVKSRCALIYWRYVKAEGRVMLKKMYVELPLVKVRWHWDEEGGEGMQGM